MIIWQQLLLIKMLKNVGTTGVLMALVLGLACKGCDSSGIFGFDVHHRLSDPVKAMFPFDNKLPEKGTTEYYTAMVHRDRLFHGRRLAAGDGIGQAPLTFAGGNDTVRQDFLAYLYYANVSVGTPATWFLVALDTGSHLFWLPCECAPNCKFSANISPTEAVNFNIYSPRSSSTGSQLSCTSPFCPSGISCSPSRIICPYQVTYLSENTSSSGFLVEDVLHLTTNTKPSIPTDVRIVLGCGVVQTGSFLESGAPNGLLGLGMHELSIPSLLASQNIAANSFSMCFGRNGLGKISFGDKGSKGQAEAPLNPDPFDLYNVSITQVAVGTNASAVNFSVIIDSGTSFTFLTDPAYTLLSELFNSQVKDVRQIVDPDSPFEYCYRRDLFSDNVIPAINLTTIGGDNFSVTHPALMITFEDMYCLGVVKSDEKDVNIIGENFMSGYRVVFDHEKKVLGWKTSECDEPVLPSRRSPIPFASPRTSGATSTLAQGCLGVFILQMILFMFFHSL